MWISPQLCRIGCDFDTDKVFFKVLGPVDGFIDVFIDGFIANGNSYYFGHKY